MKSSPGNIAVDSVDHLAAIIRNRLKRIQYRPDLIPGFLAQTGLSLEPEPPSPKQTPDFQPLHERWCGAVSLTVFPAILVNRFQRLG
ncbi:hypothetical protein ACWD6N_37390 [Micromonospora sp. NPDC005163]